jgi:apolipoprotein N-acyltransferase
MINITNDAWYGNTTGPYQHFAIARVRAVEEGLPLVRAANTGVSGVIDSVGRLRARLGLGKQGFIDSDLPAPLPLTFFARWGAISLWTIFLVTTLGLIIIKRRKASFFR